MASHVQLWLPTWLSPSDSGAGSNLLLYLTANCKHCSYQLSTLLVRRHQTGFWTPPLPLRVLPKTENSPTSRSIVYNSLSLKGTQLPTLEGKGMSRSFVCELRNSGGAELLNPLLFFFNTCGYHLSMARDTTMHCRLPGHCVGSITTTVELHPTKIDSYVSCTVQNVNIP
jgi:hypothetical protein